MPIVIEVGTTEGYNVVGVFNDSINALQDEQNDARLFVKELLADPQTKVMGERIHVTQWQGRKSVPIAGFSLLFQHYDELGDKDGPATMWQGSYEWLKELQPS